MIEKGVKKEKFYIKIKNSIQKLASLDFYFLCFIMIVQDFYELLKFIVLIKNKKRRCKKYEEEY